MLQKNLELICSMDFVFNTSELLTLLCTISILYLTSLAFYRLFLHPLAKFPGPKLAALTRYYEGYYDVVQGGRYTWKIAELHDKYGMSMRNDRTQQAKPT